MQAIIIILDTVYNISTAPTPFNRHSFVARKGDEFLGFLHDTPFYGAALLALKAQASDEFKNSLPTYLREAIETSDAPLLPPRPRKTRKPGPVVDLLALLNETADVA